MTPAPSLAPEAARKNAGQFPVAARKRIAQTAAAGVFALQHQADAAIVYSGLQNVVASVPAVSGFVSVNVDFNGGGADWQLSVFATANIGRASIGALPGKQAEFGAGLLNKLASGANISAGLAGWATGFGLVRRSSYFGVSGQWLLSNQTGFGAFRLNTGSGNYQYGWVRLKWADSADANPYPNTIVAIDWAYESTLNQPIQAGAGAPIPEPSRALLMLAGAGAAFLRRRRKSH